MLPILFKIGPLTIRTYGLLLALGFALAIFTAVKRSRKLGVDPELTLDISFYIILSGIAGARIYYVLQYPGHYLSHPLEILKVWEGGLVYYGGLIGAVAASWVYLALKKEPKLRLGDLAAPSIALGHAVGRLGCFTAGCCYGSPCTGPLAVTFNDKLTLAPPGVPLHPAQIYMALADLAIVLVLLAVERRKRFVGQTFLSYFLLYAAARFFLEWFRGDERGSFLGSPLSPAQGISLIGFLAAAVLWAVISRRAGARGR